MSCSGVALAKPSQGQERVEAFEVHLQSEGMDMPCCAIGTLCREPSGLRVWKGRGSEEWKGKKSGKNDVQWAC